MSFLDLRLLLHPADYQIWCPPSSLRPSILPLEIQRLQPLPKLPSFTSAFIISGGTGSPLNSTLFYSLYLYLKAFREFQMGYASAMAWVLLAIIGAITGLMFAFANKWVYYD